MDSVSNIDTAPEIKHNNTTMERMLDFIIALLPACVFGCILFGIRAAFVLLATVAGALISEFLWNKIRKQSLTIGDLTAAAIGLLLGMNLPSTFPIWLAAISGAFAIIVVKLLLGEIAGFALNPVITVRILLAAIFPRLMNNFIEPVSYMPVSSATPLVSETTPIFKNLFFGLHSGCIGETSSFLLLVGGLYLVLRRVINPIIPLCFVGTVALGTVIWGGNLGVSLFGGGLMLGAIFIATDSSISPKTKIGKLIFGVCCGIITFALRQFTPLPEGTAYAILGMNILYIVISKLDLLKIKEKAVEIFSVIGKKIKEVFTALTGFINEKIIKKIKFKFGRKNGS